MKKIVSVFILFCGQLISAQVGINTTNPNAQLDVQSSNQAAPSNTDGILIPKIDVFPASNPTAAQQGMMVYLTTASGSNLAGFYYWDNTTTTWLGFGNNNNNWKITGNSGTSATTNFIGTTDNVDLVFKRFNTESGRIGNSNTFFGRLCGSVSTGINNTYLGIEAGRDNITGINNVFIGRRAGTIGTVGSDNVLIGNGAGISNNANQNAFIGSFSGNANSSGTNNSFFGYFAGSNNITGAQNTYLGAGSGGINTTGIGNTMIGTNTNATVNNLTNAAAIGFNAQVAASNSLILGSVSGVNAAAASTSVGIGTTTPTGVLDVAASTNGILIPRVVLSSVLVQSPIVNPQGGALPTSTLVYNTATAGVSPNNVYPGFYYWNGVRWIRFDVNGENNPTYYTAVGTTNAFTSTVFAPLPQMIITFTPKDDIALVNFSAAGHRTDDSCAENVIFFQLLLNGVPVTGWQTAANQSVVNFGAFGNDDIVTWDTNITYPITVPIGISQTIQIQWYSPACTMSNTVASPLTAFGSVFKSYRTLTVIDPNGGGGIVGAPPVTTNLWAHNGNSGTNSVLNFVGTSDAQALVLKSNNVEGMRIATNGNVGIGTSSPLDKIHVNGNIRMVDGNQAAGKVLTSDANGTGTWQNASDNAWGLVGNTGTNAATNFIGTTDNNDLVFKRFNTRAGLIGSTNTSFGVAALNPTTTGTNNTAIGSGSLDTNTTGIDNMAAGFNTLTSNTTGSHNTTIGVAAMASNSTGNFNTAIGRSALFDNTSGINNTGVGYNALGNVTTGTNNTAIGYNSFPGFNQGNNNTALGAETTASSTIFDNATAIGYRAMVGNSNTMVLGSINGVNGATSSVNVGIGTISPQAALEVVDSNAVTSASVEGTVNVMTNGAQAIDTGGSITLGGAITDAGTTFRTFGSIEGRKANATTNSSSGYLLFKTNNAGTLTERIRITSAGDVGIGTAAPGGQFELSLNEGRKPTSNTWTIPSDARLKNVNGIYEKGLKELLQLKPIRYHYKNTDKRTFDPKVLAKEAYGFLAQEVQPLFPEAVGTDPDGYLNFDLHPILIASVNAFKELDAKNKELQAENESLKAALEKLTEKVDFILNEMQKR